MFRGHRPLTVLALALVLGLGACAHDSHTGWKVYRTRHITMYTNTKFLHSHTLESLEYAYSGLAGSLFPGRGIAPVEVLFLEWPQFLSTLGRYRRGVVIPKLPGRGMLARRGLIVLGEDQDEGRAGLTQAAHKLAHAFLHAAMPKAPLWLHEGYASYVETVQIRAKGNEMSACLGHLGGEQPAVTMDELFGWTWVALDESKKAAWYRFTARTLIDYFLTGEEGKLRAPFAQFVQALGKGEDTRAALAKFFPDLTVAELGKRIMDHRRESEMRPRGLCPIESSIPPEHRADTGKPRVSPAEKDDIAQLTFRLLLLPRRAGYMDWYPPDAMVLRAPEAAR